METSKLQPINLQQGLLLSPTGNVEGVYNHWKKTVYFKHGIHGAKHIVLPDEIKQYEHNYDYDSFGFDGWNINKGRSESI